MVIYKADLVVIISLDWGDNVVAAGMADRREATQRPGAKRRAEGEGPATRS
ncbi:MAG: hypothetical protein IJ335_07385 [Lachnospiraceae bacterium]|nr:hypothetical protein [Lachnospiraceae bacterium]